MTTPSTGPPTGLAGLRYPITQVSLAVRDLDALVDRYHHAFGWAPWQVFRHDLPLHHATELRGTPVHYAMYGAEVYVGAMNFELLEPIEGPNLWSEYIDEHGEGIASIATMFLAREDGDAVKTAFQDTFDIAVINRAQIGDHIEYYYLDTEARFGCLIESGSGHAIDFIEPVRVHPQEGATWGVSPASGLRYRISQVTLVTRDLRATMEAYHRAFGWGPWRIFDSTGATPVSDAIYRGKATRFAMRWAQAQVADTVFEIIEPLGGSSPWQDRLDQHGEGLIGITVPLASAADAQTMRSQFAAEGIDILASARIGHDSEWFWLDSQDRYKCVIASGPGSSFDLVTPSETYPQGP